MITSQTIKPLGPGKAVLRWTSDAAAGTVFRVFRDGRLYARTASTRLEVGFDRAASPQFEVFDDTTGAARRVFAIRQPFGSQATAAAASYAAERFVGGQWVRSETRRALTERALNVEPPVESAETVQVRIVALDESGSAIQTTEFTRLAVRTPDPPAATFSYSAATGKLTVTVG